MTGASVVLGGTQSAGGNVLVQSTAGGIDTTGAALTADSGDAGGKKLVLDSGTADLTGSGSLTAGPAKLGSDVLLATTGDIVLGAVTANALAGAASVAMPTAGKYTPTAADTLATGGAITLGAVHTTASATIGSTGTVAGHRDVTLGGVTSDTGLVDLSAASGVLSVSGDVRALGGGATLSGATITALPLTAIAAKTDVGLTSPGTITVGAVRAGAVVTVGGVGGGAAGAFSAASIQANGAIGVTATGTLALTDAATPSGTQRHKLNAALTSFDGDTVTDASISLTTTTGAISVAGGSSTGDAIFTATALGGTVGVTGTFTAGDADTTVDPTTKAPLGNIVISGISGASLASGSAQHTISVTSLKGDATIGTATAGLAAVNDPMATGGSVTAESDAVDRSATITSGTATGGDVQALATAQGGLATVSSGTTTRGDVTALALNTRGKALISAASATGGNVLADGDARATVSGATTFGSSPPGNITAHSASGAATASGMATGSVAARAAGLADASGHGDADVIASGGSAHIGTATAGGNVRALAGTGAAMIDDGKATTGNVDALAKTDATITKGTASAGSVRASAGGLATITTGVAHQSVVANGAGVMVGSATAGDDIVLIAAAGDVTAARLGVTGTGTDVPATDAADQALTFAGSTVTGSGGSNVIVRASGAATIAGQVSVVQAPAMMGEAAKTADFDVLAGAITLGTTGIALDQGAAGRVDLVTTGGAVTLLGTGGTLASNVGGAGTTNARAGMAAAGGDLTIMAATGVVGAKAALVATAKTLTTAPFVDSQAAQPGVTVTAGAAGGGSVQLASITGGAVAVYAPVTIMVPQVTATGAVALQGIAVSGNDTATVAPTTVTIDGANAGYAPVAVTVAGGAGAELTALKVANGGQVGALQVLSDTGAATLRATPADPAAIDSILVESQTGVAGILGSDTVSAGQITLRGRQDTSRVLATAPLSATGGILATGPTVTIGNATVGGTAADGSGDILIAATTAASLAAGTGETAVARRTIDVTANGTGGTVVVGDATATGGTLALGGSDVTISRRAIAGDDIVVSGAGTVTATAATLMTTGTADLQAGSDAATLGVTVIRTADGSGYGAGHSVLTDTVAQATDALTGNPVITLAGANIAVTAGGAIDLSQATVSAVPGAMQAGGLQRDVHVEAGGTLALATTTAARDLVAQGVGKVVLTGTLTAGDDLVAGSGAALDAGAATLTIVGAASDQTSAVFADGNAIVGASGGTLTALAGNNIALTAGGPITLGAIATTGAAPASLRAFSNDAITLTQALTASGSIVLVGASVASDFALTAGDDIAVIARGGTAVLNAALTTTGSAASSAPLVDLGGGDIALPGEAALGRVEGASILVAASGAATVSDAVTSAGRYSVIGRGGVTLGTAGGTTQSAAGDVLVAASTGAMPAPASVTLADGLVLTANSDGVEAARTGGFVAEPLLFQLGNGDLLGGGATVRAGRTLLASLADQGTVQVQATVAGGVHSIALATLDSASADLRAQGNVTIGGALVDAGLTLASAAGSVSLPTLTIGTGVPLMTAGEQGAIDIKLVAATGASLGTIGGATLARDVTIATTAGDASLTTASARDDIVVTSASGHATAGTLTFAGTASDFRRRRRDACRDRCRWRRAAGSLRPRRIDPDGPCRTDDRRRRRGRRQPGHRPHRRQRRARRRSRPRRRRPGNPDHRRDRRTCRAGAGHRRQPQRHGDRDHARREWRPDRRWRHR